MVVEIVEKTAEFLGSLVVKIYKSFGIGLVLKNLPARKPEKVKSKRKQEQE